MSMSVGASSGALSYLQQLLAQGAAGASTAASGADPLSLLLQSISGPSASAGQTGSATAAAGPAASSACPPFGADTMAALISLQGQPSDGGEMSKMFATFDTNSDGQISKSEFDTAFSQAGVDSATTDAAFAKLDTNGDGSVSQSELAAAKTHHGHHHHHAEGGGESQASASSGMNALDTLLSSAGADGATTKTATNSDGSTSTTISYVDGTTIDMTTPAPSTNGGTSSAATSNGTGTQSNANLLEQLIQLQSQLLTAAASTLSAIA